MKRSSVSPSVPSIDSGMWRVCCWAPCGHESGGCRRPAAMAPRHNFSSKCGQCHVDSGGNTVLFVRYTHPFNSPLSLTTRVSRYQKGKTNLNFTEARDGEWQWHQLGRMQFCTSLQTDNHTNTPPLSFLQARCPSCHPTNSVKALKVCSLHNRAYMIWWHRALTTVTYSSACTVQDLLICCFCQTGPSSLNCMYLPAYLLHDSIHAIIVLVIKSSYLLFNVSQYMATIVSFFTNVM